MVEELYTDLMKLTPEEVEERLVFWREEFDGERREQFSTTEYVFSQDEAERFMEYLHTLMFAKHFEESAFILPFIRDYLDKMKMQAGDVVWLIELIIEWNYVAIRFISFDKNSFGEYEFLREIIDITEGKDGALKLKNRQAKLGLLTAYHYWLKQGGIIGVFEEKIFKDEQTWIEELNNTFLPSILEELSVQTIAKNYEFVVQIKRALARYYIQNNMPNEGLVLLKELLVDLENYKEKSEAEVADLNMEIGTMLTQYKKYGSAKPYFISAKEQYEKLGEEFETFAYQAEGWIEECEAKNK